ncbi:hypothetical protein KQH54_00475 [bacterium]|nr:hypothetical protein [bacterium]
MEKSKKLPLWLRWWGLLNIAVTFVWVPIEDVQTLFISILAGLWCVWFGGWLWTRFAHRWGVIYRGVAVGGFSGAMFFPMALFLAVLKGGIHAHGFLEYSNYELGILLSYTPVTVIVGAALGGGIGFWSKKWGENGNSGQNV